MQIRKGTGIDWRERSLISNLYVAQRVKVRLNRGEARSVKIGRGVRQECCLSPVQLVQRMAYKASSGRVWRLQHRRAHHSHCEICRRLCVSKEEKLLHDMIDKLIEIGRCYGMEMNVEKTKVMRISRQPFPVEIMIEQK